MNKITIFSLTLLFALILPLFANAQVPVVPSDKELYSPFENADADKFKEMKLTPLNCSEVSCPMIAESPINLECKVREIHEYPTHDMFVAEIVKIHVDTGLMEEDGRLSADKAGLLAYVHGEYFGIKKNPIGRFGFSVMKRKTKKRINREKNLDRKARNHRRRRG